jgi:hypothetical protein
MINKADRKNTIILAFVISLCFVCLLYSIGFINYLKAVLPKNAPGSPVVN